MQKILLEFYNHLDRNLIESIPSVILGIFLFALYKHTSKKKLWLVLGCIPLVVIVARSLQWIIAYDSYDMAVVGIYVTAFYAIGCLFGNFFNPRKIWHWVLGPIALLLVFLIPNIVSYFSEDYWHPFGTIVDEPLALDSAGAFANNSANDSAGFPVSNFADGSSITSTRFDYELKISFSDAFVFDKRIATIRVKGDSALVCTSKKVCGVMDSVETCEWKTSEPARSLSKEPPMQYLVKIDSASFGKLKGSTSPFCVFCTLPYVVIEKKPIEFTFESSPENKSISKIHELKKLVESYQEEKIPYDVFDGYIFEVTLLDYRRGVKRYLDLSNAMVGKPDDVPNAKRIDQMAHPFLPIDKNTPLDWDGKKCHNSETKDSLSPKS